LVLVLALVGVVLPAAGLAVAALDQPHTLLTSVDTVLSGRARDGLHVAAVGIVAALAGAAGSGAALWTRWRRARSEERQQIKWLALGGLVTLVALACETADIPGAWLLAAVATPVAAGAAILLHRLYDIDLFLNRSLVYAVLSGVLVAAYVGMVSVLDAVTDGVDDSGQRLLATAFVAVGFHPLHLRVQRLVDELLFGNRADPYAAVTTFGRRLDACRAPDDEPTAVLREIAHTVRDVLQLPYAEVRIDREPQPALRVEDGRRAGPVVPFSMTFRGEEVGQLSVAPRRPGEALTEDEQGLLCELARQSGAVARATALSLELQRSRDRLIRSREEERRRLRRDLHDRLGAALAGFRMQVGGVLVLLSNGEQARAEGILTGLDTELGRCAADVRALVDGLAPAALHQVGLPAAVRRATAPLCSAGGRLTVEIVSPGVLDHPGGLPAAVELAAYHIAVEAVTNSARHSGARCCQVTLTLSAAELVVIVRDDGHGLLDHVRRTRSAMVGGGDVRPGVGLESMQQRAAELGGTCYVDHSAEGTRVHARLPLGVQ
jgi:signal transduction histidine kinase